MRTIIHNLDDISFLNTTDDIIIKSSNTNHCIGCFKCWTDNNTCCIKDKIYDISKKLLDSDELIIISKCINGCYESNIKKVLERNISYVEPYFKMVGKEMHHKTKTSKNINFKVFFYGNNISEMDKKIASNLVNRNSINLYTEKPIIKFINNYKEIKL